VAMNDDADANVWSSGSQRLRGVFTDRLDDALCRLFTSTEGANASTTLTDSASTAHIVDIIVNLMVILCSTLELELLSMSYYTEILPLSPGGGGRRRRRRLCQWCQWFPPFRVEEDLDTWSKSTDRRSSDVCTARSFSGLSGDGKTVTRGVARMMSIHYLSGRVGCPALHSLALHSVALRNRSRCLRLHIPRQDYF
jgi:hypothetical protein